MPSSDSPGVPGFGFSFGRLDDGTAWLRSRDGRFKRISAELLAELAAHAPSGLDAMANRAVDATVPALLAQLAREGFLIPGAAVDEQQAIADIAIVPRVAAFVLAFFALAIGVWLDLDAALAAPVQDPWVNAWALLFFVGTAALHEFGHWAACRPYFRARIGFGLLSGFIPAFVTYTNDAWTCPRNVRIWVNLAGPMVELVIGLLVLALYYTLLANGLLITVALVLCLRVVFVLNPLLEGDGYWCLSDGLGVVNLRTRGIADLRARRVSGASAYALGALSFTGLSIAIIGYIILGVVTHA